MTYFHHFPRFFNGYGGRLFLAGYDVILLGSARKGFRKMNEVHVEVLKEDGTVPYK